MMNYGSFPTPNEVLDPQTTAEFTTLTNYIQSRIWEYNPNKEGGLMIRLPIGNEGWEKHKFRINEYLSSYGWNIERLKTYEFRQVSSKSMGFYYEGVVQLVRIQPIEPVEKICYKKKQKNHK